MQFEENNYLNVSGEVHSETANQDFNSKILAKISAEVKNEGNPNEDVVYGKFPQQEDVVYGKYPKQQEN